MVKQGKWMWIGKGEFTALIGINSGASFLQVRSHAHDLKSLALNKRIDETSPMDHLPRGPGYVGVQLCASSTEHPYAAGPPT